MDTLAAVRITAAEQQQLFASVKASGRQHVISVVAFRGQNRSEAHYIESDTSAFAVLRPSGAALPGRRCPPATVLPHNPPP